MRSESNTTSVVDQNITVAEHTECKGREGLVIGSGMVDPSSVIAEFLNVEIQMKEMLKQCNSELFVEKCVSLLASITHEVPLFPNSYAKYLQETQNAPDFIQKLSLFMTWDNHCILNTIAEISNVPEAKLLVTQFDNRLDLSLPLEKFPIPEPSQHMVPYDNSTHTILAVKLDLEVCHCALQNVIDARSLIQNQCKLTPYCLHLLALAKSNSTLIYWMIPKDVAHLIIGNVLHFQNYYRENGILQLAVYPGVILCTDSILKVGPMSFFSFADGKLVRFKLNFYCSS